MPVGSTRVSDVLILIPGGKYMALPTFDYVKAASLDEASELQKKAGNTAMIMAGGTDIIPLLRDRKRTELKTIIDIKGIPGLDGLTYEEGKGLKIGGLTKLYTIQNDPVVNEKNKAVADAAHYVASAQIRRKGTMAGNICNASPSADTAPILIAMDASVKIYNKETGERTVPMDNFFTGFKKTAVVPENGDILTEIDIPDLGPGEGFAYLDHSVRKAMDLAIVGVAAWLKMDGRKVEDVRLALGGVAITPIRAPKAEAFLKGKELTDDVLERAGEIASGECSPIDDVRASAEYRTDMIRVYTKRAVKKAADSIKA